MQLGWNKVGFCAVSVRWLHVKIAFWLSAQMTQTNCARVQTNSTKHATHWLAFSSTPSLPLCLSIYLFLHSLSLWIIITYHTGLITASKRVSMKTLITVLGAEHSALIPSNTHMKRNSWGKTRKIKRLFFNRNLCQLWIWWTFAPQWQQIWNNSSLQSYACCMSFRNTDLYSLCAVIILSFTSDLFFLPNTMVSFNVD